MSFIHHFLTSFPVPTRIAMPAVGLDISDQSVKCIELVHHGHADMRVGRYATKEIPKGIIVGGAITNREQLIESLSAFRKDHGLSFVHASLPEEPGYIFTAKVPLVSPEEIRSLLRFKLEEHVPITPTEAVLDYDLIRILPAEKGGTAQAVVAVSVFPERLAQEYADLLHDSGFTPVSLEIEAQAIARAVVPHGETATRMIVDIGRSRSGVSITQGRAVRFTTTLMRGGDALTTLMQELLPDADEAELLRIKNEEGLAYNKQRAVKEAMEEFARMLAADIDKYLLYWQTHRDAQERTDEALAHAPIDSILLSGGYSNIAGLPEYLSRALRVTVERANVWTNAFSLENYIPALSYRDSLGYASAIGLALQDHKE
jgi:type IV pilus assembly protein PilM